MQDIKTSRLKAWLSSTICFSRLLTVFLILFGKKNVSYLTKVFMLGNHHMVKGSLPWGLTKELTSVQGERSKGASGPKAQLWPSKVSSVQFLQVLYSAHYLALLLSSHTFLGTPWFEHRAHVVTTSLVHTSKHFLSHHVPPGKPEEMTCSSLFTSALTAPFLITSTQQSLSFLHFYLLIYWSH